MYAVDSLRSRNQIAQAQEEEASDNPLSLSFQQWETKEKEVGEGGKVLDFEGRSEERKE